MATRIPGPPGKTRFLDGDFTGPAWIRWFNQLIDGIAAGIGIGSINGDTTSDQLIKGAGSVSVSTKGGITTVTGAGAAAGQGLLSINADTSAAQLLIGGTNVTIQDAAGGRHLISAKAGITSINSDITPAQQIVGSGSITVGTSYGVTTIGGGGGGISSINGDTTAGQTITGANGITVATISGTTTITAPLQWVPYTGPPQSFLKGQMTRDGDWTMVANKNTSDRPAPQQSGNEEDLLPVWTPTTQSARATYTIYNEWTLSSAGWIDQYGADILAQNIGATHVIKLSVNGVVKDTYTAVPGTSGLYWQNITPIVVAIGAVIRVTVTVTEVGNNLMYWLQQTALFATAPAYCSLAVGSKDGAAAGTTAYGCHLLFILGTASPDWDVVAYSGAPGAGGGAAVTFAGDLSGSSTSQTVVGLEGKPLDAVTVGTPTDGQVITWVAANSLYKAVTPAAIPTTMALSAITPAVAVSTIANASNTQTWNWALTGASNGMVFGESAAGSGTGAVVQINALSSAVYGLQVNGVTCLPSTAMTGGQIQFGSPLANVYNSIASGIGAPGAFNITMGCYYNTGSSAWIPTLTNASSINLGIGGGLNFYSNYGLTVGTAFTPAVLESIIPISAGNGVSHYFYNTSSLVIQNSLNSYSNIIALAENSYYNGASWYARGINANAIQIGPAGTAFFSNTGLTIGATFTPTQIAALSVPSVNTIQLQLNGTGLNVATIYNYLVSGAHFTGSWVADNSGYSGVINTPNGVIGFNINTGLTVGNAFTPTQVGYIDSAGYHVGSDYRYKENIRSLDSALSMIMKLRPVSFKWRIGLDNERDHIGLISHEVQEAIPSAIDVKKDLVRDDGGILPQTLNYNEIVATLVRAVQELAEKVNGSGIRGWR